METSIYLLRDPETGAVRYIGKTTQPLHRRLAQHVRNPSGKDVRRWVQKLKADGKSPSIELVEVCQEDWQTRERFWINHYRNLGAELLNVAEGGSGCKGFNHTDEAKEKISKAFRGRKHRPETIEKLRKRLFTEEHRRNISEARRGAVISDGQRAAIAKTLTGRTASDATRAKLAESVKRAWAEGRLTRGRRAG